MKKVYEKNNTVSYEYILDMTDMISVQLEAPFPYRNIQATVKNCSIYCREYRSLLINHSK